MSIGTPVPLLALQAAAASGTAKTTTADAPAGSLIVVCISSNSNADIAFSGSVNDSAGNSYSLAEQGVIASGIYQAGIYYSMNTAFDLPIGGTITPSVMTGATLNWCAWAVSGIGAGSVEQPATLNKTTAVATFSLATGSLTAAPAIVFGDATFSANPAAYAGASPFTELYTAAQVEANGCAAAYDIVSDTTSVAWAPTFSSEKLQAVIAAFSAGSVSSLFTPGAASLTLSAVAPVVARNFVLTPGAASLTLSPEPRPQFRD